MILATLVAFAHYVRSAKDNVQHSGGVPVIASELCERGNLLRFERGLQRPIYLCFGLKGSGRRACNAYLPRRTRNIYAVPFVQKELSRSR